MLGEQKKQQSESAERRGNFGTSIGWFKNADDSLVRLAFQRAALE